MISITLRQMAYFEALAELRHFGRAARVSHVTQPALSAQIAEMEERLGVRLFERTGRAALLTADGERLRPAIARILAAARDLEMQARRGHGLLEGRFRLGIIPTIAPYILPGLLEAVARQHPGLALEVREAVTPALVELTVAGELDAMLAAAPLAHESLATLDLFEDRFFLAAASGDPAFEEPPVAPANPVLERLMLLGEGHCLRDQALELCGDVKPLTMASYGATSLGTLLQMVEHGIGVTLVPEMALAVEGRRQGLRMLPFTAPEPSRTVCLGFRRTAGRERDIAALGDLLREIRPVSGRAPSASTYKGRPAAASRP